MSACVYYVVVVIIIIFLVAAVRYFLSILAVYLYRDRRCMLWSSC